MQQFHGLAASAVPGPDPDRLRRERNRLSQQRRRQRVRESRAQATDGPSASRQLQHEHKPPPFPPSDNSLASSDDWSIAMLSYTGQSIEPPQPGLTLSPVMGEDAYDENDMDNDFLTSALSSSQDMFDSNWQASTASVDGARPHDLIASGPRSPVRGSCSSVPSLTVGASRQRAALQSEHASATSLPTTSTNSDSHPARPRQQAATQPYPVVIDDDSPSPAATSSRSSDLVSSVPGLTPPRRRPHCRLIDGAVPEGRTALHMLCESGPYDSVATMLRAGACASARDEFGMNALHLAARRGNPAALAALLDSGSVAADVRDRQGWTPLHHAAWCGYDEAIALLVERGAAIEAGIDASMPVSSALRWRPGGSGREGSRLGQPAHKPKRPPERRAW